MTAASMRGYGFRPRSRRDRRGSARPRITSRSRTRFPSWTLELEPANGGQDYGGLASHGHSGFILPDAEAARMRDDVARMYLLGFYRQSGPPAVLAAQIRDRDSDQVVYAAALAADFRRRAHLTTVDERGAGAGPQLPALGRIQQADAHPRRCRQRRGLSRPERGASVGTVTLEFPDLTGQDLALAVAAGDAGSRRRAARRADSCAIATMPSQSTSRCRRIFRSPVRPVPCCRCRCAILPTWRSMRIPPRPRTGRADTGCG